MSVSGIDSLPTVDRALLPADIRRASKEDQQAFRAALGFEQALLSEMLRSVDTLGAAGGEEAPAAYREMLPTTLAESVTAQGGIGLARVLFESFRSGR
jgi:Rod binding domain-containing protein